MWTQLLLLLLLLLLWFASILCTILLLLLLLLLVECACNQLLEVWHRGVLQQQPGKQLRLLHNLSICKSSRIGAAAGQHASLIFRCRAKVG
jgi:hypothetical protein